MALFLDSLFCIFIFIFIFIFYFYFQVESCVEFVIELWESIMNSDTISF